VTSYVTASIGDQKCGIAVLQVQDVLAPQRLTPVPLAPPDASEKPSASTTASPNFVATSRLLSRRWSRVTLRTTAPNKTVIPSA